MSTATRTKRRSAKTKPPRPALAADGGSITVGNKRLSLSNLQKVLYPSGFTKGDVISYYLRVAPAILPHLAGRAVTLKRYPDGAQAPFFFAKNCPDHRPPWVETAHIEGRGGGGGGGVNHCLVSEVATLLWVANLASIELHAPLARADNPDRPTVMVFDLDPGPPAGVLDAVRLGLRLHDVLIRIGLRSFAKTSGGKGLHVYVPLNNPAVTFDDTKDFARAVALLFERQHPDKVTATMARQQRGGKVFVDWSQNDRHKTTACAYTLRAGPKPTVSTPVTWDELDAAARADDSVALTFTAPDALERLRTEGDLFAPVLTLRQRLPRFD
jgi:bifunctional non-homologous end joining protein LigD